MRATESRDKKMESIVRQFGTVSERATEELKNKERAIEELKNKRTALGSDLQAASADLQRLKEARITAGEEARELRIELETVKASLNFRKAKLSSQQQDIFKANTLWKTLKEEEVRIRDSFISTMMEINQTLREMQSTHSRPPLRRDNQSSGSDSANPEKSQPSREPGVAITSMDIVDEGAVHQEELISELLREICTAESALLPLRTKLDCQHEKLRNCRQKHAEYIESIGQATEDLTSARKYPLELSSFSNSSQELEDQVSSLTTDLQDMYVCPQCANDNLGQATG